MIKIFATGNIGKDAEVKHVGDTNIVSFSIASTKKGYTKQDGTVIEDITTWLNVRKWKAEGLAPYLTKGTKVSIHGDLEIREHEGKYYTTLIASEIEFNSNKGNNQTEEVPF